MSCDSEGVSLRERFCAFLLCRKIDNREFERAARLESKLFRRTNVGKKYRKDIVWEYQENFSLPVFGASKAEVF